MDTCIRNGNFDEALDLRVGRLTYPFPLLCCLVLHPWPHISGLTSLAAWDVPWSLTSPLAVLASGASTRLHADAAEPRAGRRGCSESLAGEVDSRGSVFAQGQSILTVLGQ
jgi:hypothetical protein